MLSRKVHQELWTYVSTCPAFSHEELSFALAGGDKPLILRLRDSLESNSHHLAALGLSTVVERLYSNGVDRASATITRGMNTQSIKASSSPRVLAQATGTSQKRQANSSSQIGTSGTQSKVTRIDRYKPLATCPKRVERVCSVIARQSLDRGQNKSLHDTCVVCKHFKDRAPKNGLFRAKQYKAIVMSHDTSLSAKRREKMLILAFPQLCSPQASHKQSGSEPMDIGVGSSNPPKQPACQSQGQDNVSKKLTRAEKKEHRVTALDDLTVQHQVLEEAIRTQRSTLAERTYVDVVKDRVVVPEKSLELAKLLQEKRDVQKKRKTLMSSVTGRSKVKTSK